ncbi:MAG: hypothetical protein AAFU85_22305, partial [Planctomycetota bacterium]
VTAAPLARAQNSATLTDGTQPPVVLTVASLNKLMQDTNYITGVAGQPQFGGMFAMMVGGFAAGIDMDRPIGMVLPLVNGVPQPIVLVPTSDIKSILKRYEAQTGPVDELDDGTLVISVNQNTVYIKQRGNTAIAAQDASVIDLIPADPAGLFAGMGNAYDIAVRVKIQEVPAEIRGMLMDQMRQGFDQAMAAQPNGDQTRAMAENSIAQLEQLIQDSDEMKFGINIDQSSKNIAMDFSFTAVGGSKMAAMYGSQQSIPSQFASVIRDDAAAYFHGASSVGQEMIDQSKDSVENAITMVQGALANEGALTDDQLAKIDLYVSRVADIFMDSISEGKSDAGGLLLANKDKLQFVFGMFVADGGKVADLAKDLAKEVPDVDGAPRFKFDIGTYEGVTMHVIEADVPASADEARQVFGEKLQIYIGTAPKAVYMCLGRDSSDLLKQFIKSGGGDTATDRPLAQFKLKLLPIMEFAQSVEANDGIAAMINALSSSQDKGDITVISDSIPNGSDMKMTIGEGLIKAIAAAAIAGQQAGAAF